MSLVYWGCYRSWFGKWLLFCCVFVPTCLPPPLRKWRSDVTQPPYSCLFLSLEPQNKLPLAALNGLTLKSRELRFHKAMRIWEGNDMTVCDLCSRCNINLDIFTRVKFLLSLSNAFIAFCFCEWQCFSSYKLYV